MAFAGFPPEAIEFYEQLAADNSKAFWTANKHRFVEHVKGPMTELTEALADYGPFHLFRPHNDLRFSKNKPPYKSHQGAYGESEGRARPVRAVVGRRAHGGHRVLRHGARPAEAVSRRGRRRCDR